MGDFQKHPILDPSSSIQSGSGSVGVFVCDSSNPFDYTALTGKNKNKLGYAVQFVTRDGSDVAVASAALNGAIGNSSFIVGTWGSGQGFAVEIESLTMTTGFAIIYLKNSPHKP